MNNVIQTIQTFVENYGYWAVLFGAIIEGESIILIACYFSYIGVLYFPYVVAIAFFGTLFGDQAMYYVGRYFGPNILEKFPKSRAPAGKAFYLLHKWDIWYILSFRFIYGIRIMSPIIIGTSGIPPKRFIPLNFIASLIWTVISCGAGYLAGNAVQKVIDNWHIIQQYLTILLVSVIGIIAMIVYFVNRRKPDPKKQKQQQLKEMALITKILDDFKKLKGKNEN